MDFESRKKRREALMQQRREQKRAAKKLRLEQPSSSKGASRPNSVSPFKTVDQEIEARLDAAAGQAAIIRSKLPIILKRLARIEDPRNPRKLKHKLTVLMIYGILMFVYQVSSRREANREFTNPIFKKNLILLFPDLEDLPHQDTLMRLLSRIDANQIEAIHVELIKELIRKKKFNRWLIKNQYPIAIDGTKKFGRNWLFSDECLERDHKNGTTEYFIYILEANLAFQNGMTLPLMSEVLEFNAQDSEAKKQDCELTAFKRLAERLKKFFPKLRILVLIDGLYANGPLMEICRKYHWGFMIVLQDKCLPTVWEEYHALKELEPNNNCKQSWGGRQQCFHWVNFIEYHYGEGDMQILHVVVCEEEWEAINDKGEKVTKKSRWAWISSEPLSWQNVHERCNLAARNRWAIETNFLVEKRHGYQYEHCFSYDWKAMKGYHYLMRLGHLLNVLAEYSTRLSKIVRTMGMTCLIRFIRITLSGFLDPVKLQEKLNLSFQLRLE